MLIVVGGYDDTYLDSTEVMDYTTLDGSWREVSSMKWREVICFLESLISCFETTLTNNMYNLYTNVKRVKKLGHSHAFTQKWSQRSLC